MKCSNMIQGSDPIGISRQRLLLLLYEEPWFTQNLKKEKPSLISLLQLLATKPVQNPKYGHIFVCTFTIS